MNISKEKIEQNKQEFLSLLRTVNRPGMDALIDWLENKSDFFTAPASSVYHGAIEGGLCQHSLNVYYALQKQIETMQVLALPEKQLNNVPQDTIIISALLHDICKTNFYQKEIKFYKEDGDNAWHRYYGYKCVDNFPLGHGEKSVIMLQNFLKLTANEIVAIRWHMGATDPGTFLSSFEKPAYGQSVNICPLLVLLENADRFASFMMEPECDPKVDNKID